MMSMFKKHGPGKGSKRRRAKEAQERAEREQRERKERRDKDEGGAQGAPAEVAVGDTAAERYDERRDAFVDRYGRVGRGLHAAAWWAHNCVAHPLLGLFPGARTVRLHDATSDWLNLRDAPSRSSMPDIPRRLPWIVHNCVAHPLIGVAPRPATFDLHETTAEAMDVDGWV